MLAVFIHTVTSTSISVGERVPDATLSEYIETATESCPLGRNNFQVADLVKGKKIAVFAVPGAFTPTRSEQHLPGFIAKADAFKAAGVDEIWCVAVNDPFVMGAWGKSLASGQGPFAWLTAAPSGPKHWVWNLT